MLSRYIGNSEGEGRGRERERSRNRDGQRTYTERQRQRLGYRNKRAQTVNIDREIETRKGERDKKGEDILLLGFAQSTDLTKIDFLSVRNVFSIWPHSPS